MLDQNLRNHFRALCRFRAGLQTFAFTCDHVQRGGDLLRPGLRVDGLCDTLGMGVRLGFCCQNLDGTNNICLHIFFPMETLQPDVDHEYGTCRLLFRSSVAKHAICAQYASRPRRTHGDILPTPRMSTADRSSARYRYKPRYRSMYPKDRRRH